MRFPLALLAFTLACTSAADPVGPDLRKGGGSARTKAEFAWACTGLTCTFTRLEAQRGPEITGQFWYLYDAEPFGSVPNGSALEGNPLTFTFPAPDTYVVRLVALAGVKAYIVDSLVTVQ